ncbi:response regulator transcription factor [Pseudomonas sp. PDM17]|uniref:response regulator transcription factor n=1 Tax=Pseudomonas sp. PDM17 TaxID=2769285 RepID=UPI0017811DD3|nr:response regulator [Pseudomonas sp. PDM17]MBD9504605.1 response regulator transcription factor [Pseudomonas sp. PDM17]
MKKIAVIEDSRDVNAALTEFCKKLGNDINVDQFYDRESAESAIKETNYNLIVLDIELPPEKNAGIGIVYTNVTHHKSPVLVVSGLEQTVYKNVMSQLNVWDYLEKPIAADGQEFISSALRMLRAKIDIPVTQTPDLVIHDSSTGKVTYDGSPLNLPQTAKLILMRTYERRGKCVSYPEYYDLVKTGKNPEAIRQHVKTIRDALIEAGIEKEHIAVIRMKGVQWQD